MFALSDESHSYDDSGNRTNTGYTTGDHNRLTADGTYTYTYDHNGNRVRRFDAAGNQVKNTWDHRNRLTKVEFRNSSSVNTKVVEYEYDAFNRLISKTVDSDADGTIDATYHWIYDGNQAVLQFDGDTAADLSHRYLWGPAVDQLLADETVDSGGPEDVLWPLTDWQGSVRHLATYDAGTDTTTVANEKFYDAYGNVTSESNSSVDTVFGWTGRFFDEDTGLQWNLNRWYDPVVGRFVSVDPIGFAAGDPNLYRYVGNSPGMFVDPDGLWESPLWEGTKGAFVGLGRGGVNVVKGIGNVGKEIALGATDMAVGTTETVGNLCGANWHFQTYSGIGRASQQSDFSYGRHVARTGTGVVTFGTSEQIITGYEWYRGDITDDEASQRFGATGAMQFVGARYLAARPGFWNKPIPGTPKIPGAGRLLGQKPSQPGPEAPVFKPIPGSGAGKPSALRPGPYANESIPAPRPGQTLSPAMRQQINQLGCRHGCHTCGSRTPGTGTGNFIPDHQPPTAMTLPGQLQRLYPHCQKCSRSQGGQVRAWQQ